MSKPRKLFPCGKFLMGLCPSAASSCPKGIHDRDAAPLCEQWVRGDCSERCYRRHYYLEDKDKGEVEVTITGSVQNTLEDFQMKTEAVGLIEEEPQEPQEPQTDWSEMEAKSIQDSNKNMMFSKSLSHETVTNCNNNSKGNDDKKSIFIPGDKMVSQERKEMREGFQKMMESVDMKLKSKEALMGNLDKYNMLQEEVCQLNKSKKETEKELNNALEQITLLNRDHSEKLNKTAEQYETVVQLQNNTQDGLTVLIQNLREHTKILEKEKIEMAKAIQTKAFMHATKANEIKETLQILLDAKTLEFNILETTLKEKDTKLCEHEGKIGELIATGFKIGQLNEELMKNLATLKYDKEITESKFKSQVEKLKLVVKEKDSLLLDKAETIVRHQVLEANMTNEKNDAEIQTIERTSMYMERIGILEKESVKKETDKINLNNKLNRSEEVKKKLHLQIRSVLKENMRLKSQVKELQHGIGHAAMEKPNSKGHSLDNSNQPLALATVAISVRGIQSASQATTEASALVSSGQDQALKPVESCEGLRRRKTKDDKKGGILRVRPFTELQDFSKPPPPTPFAMTSEPDIRNIVEAPSSRTSFSELKPNMKTSNTSGITYQEHNDEIRSAKENNFLKGSCARRDGGESKGREYSLTREQSSTKEDYHTTNRSRSRNRNSRKRRKSKSRWD